MRPQPWAGGKDRTPQQHAQSEGAFFFAPKGVGLFFCEGGAPVSVDKSGVVSEREEGTLAVSESRVEGRRTRPKGAKPACTAGAHCWASAKLWRGRSCRGRVVLCGDQLLACRL